MPAMTRGPLPPGVYWRRRAFVGLLALSLVFLVVSWLGDWSDGSSGDAPAAAQAGAVEEATHTVTADPNPKAKPGQKNKKGNKKRAEPTLAAPSGWCAPADVVVTPIVKQAVAGRPVAVKLSLQTRTTEACNWRVGPNKVAVKISGESGDIWSARHCKAIPRQDVVVRRTVATEVSFTWDARESDYGCPGATEWVLPGELTIAAAAFGGEPVQETFTLLAPEAAPEPKKLKAQKKKGNALDRIDRR